MNCPRCGKEQPFDFKCVQCDANLSVPTPSERQSLRFYRLSLGLLVALCLWLAFDRIPSDKPFVNEPIPPAEISEEEEEFSEDIAVEEESPSAPAPIKPNFPTVIAILEKNDHTQFQILSGFRSKYPSPIQAFDISDPVSQEIRSSEALLGIGSKAVELLVQERPSAPVLFLSPEEDLANTISSKENFFGMGRYLPFEMEFQVVKRLFPDASVYGLIAKEDEETFSESNLRKLSPKVRFLSNDPVAISRDVRSARNPTLVLWVHELTPEAIDELFYSIRRRKVLTFLGLNPFPLTPIETQEAEEEVLVAEPRYKPAVSLQISSENLGRQGAKILKEIFSQGNPKPYSSMPRQALEIHIHLNRILEIEKEDLVHDLKNRATKAGLGVKIMP